MRLFYYFILLLFYYFILLLFYFTIILLFFYNLFLYDASGQRVLKKTSLAMYSRVKVDGKEMILACGYKIRSAKGISWYHW